MQLSGSNYFLGAGGSHLEIDFSVTRGLRATAAVRLGHARSSDTAAANLDILAAGPVPFCNEYF